MKKKGMKRWKKLLAGALAMVMMLAGMPTYRTEVQAGISEDDSDYMIEEIEEDGVEITKYNGNDNDVVIPSEIDGKKVIRIASRAFRGCYSLESLTIPDSVRSIGEMAFLACDSLKSVAIPASVRSIGKYAFGFNHNDTADIPFQPIPGFIIYGDNGSKAERFPFLLHCFIISKPYYLFELSNRKVMPPVFKGLF